jgi:MraZ protein
MHCTIFLFCVEKMKIDRRKAKNCTKKKKKWGNVGENGEFFISLQRTPIYYKRIAQKMRFFGNIEARTDVKGRVFLPATFRKQLQAAGEEQLVLRTDISGQCLKLYPESAWISRIDELTANVSEWDEEEQMVLREFMAEAEMLTLDGNGRFLISKRLLQAAGIGQAVRFIGMNDTIEIWALEKTANPFVPKAEFPARIRALMKKPQQ